MGACSKLNHLADLAQRFNPSVSPCYPKRFEIMAAAGNTDHRNPGNRCDLKPAGGSNIGCRVANEIH